MADMDKIERLIAGLDKAGVKKYGRNKLVSLKTAYSNGMVAKVLSGHSALTDRFIQTVCTAFHIREEWVHEGKEPILKAGTNLAELNLITTPDQQEKIIKNIRRDTEENNRKLDELKEKQSKIESDFVKFRDLIIAFMYIPVDEMDDAIEVLRAVQKLTVDDPGLIAPKK